MSTEFTSATTGETMFVRWAANHGAAFEFGTVSNFEQVAAQMRAGDTFTPENGAAMDVDPATEQQLNELVVAGRVTFGQFPVTVAAGSGEMFRFTVEADGWGG
jgi:hypothetical protein